MKIFVTGHHAAGTHALAGYLAEKRSVKYLDEGIIKGNRFDLISKIKYKEYALQCPRLSHRITDFKKLGQVVWATRDKITLIQTQKLMHSGIESFSLMRDFMQQFPNDDIWKMLKYDGSEDVLDGYIKHLALLREIKEYFRNKYWPDIETYKLEDMPYYDETKTRAYKNPMLTHLKDKIC